MRRLVVVTVVALFGLATSCSSDGPAKTATGGPTTTSGSDTSGTAASGTGATSGSVAVFTTRAECEDLVDPAQLFPDLSVLAALMQGSQTKPEERAFLRASLAWTEKIAKMVQCDADHGVFPLGDYVLALNADAVLLAYGYFSIEDMRNVAGTALTALLEDYGDSCWVPYARKWLRTGEADSDLAQLCAP